MSVRTIKVVIEIVEVCYEVGMFTVCQVFGNSTFERIRMF